MIAVSVIMPVYNAEKYLQRAIDSVLRQTLQNFELLLIDDGSTDNSPAICDEYAACDTRVKVIHQVNGGICAARNQGLAAAVGEYIAFIDNDDSYLPNLLADNYQLAKTYDADVLKYGNKYIKQQKLRTTDFDQQNHYQQERLTLVNRQNFKALYPKINDDDWLVYVWDGLFKNDFLKKQRIIFDQTFKQGHEDRIFCLALYKHIQSMVINPQIYYYHIVYQNSASRVFSLDRIEDTERLIEYEMEMCLALQLTETYPSYLMERVLIHVVFILSILRKPASELKFAELLNILKAVKQRCYDAVKPQNTYYGLLNCRSKNRVYLWLFEREYWRLLAGGLLIDRKIKHFIECLKVV